MTTSDQGAPEWPREDMGEGYAVEVLPDRLSALLRLALDELAAASVRSIRSKMARAPSADTVPSQTAPSTSCTAFAALLAHVTGGMSDLRGRGPRDRIDPLDTQLHRGRVSLMSDSSVRSVQLIAPLATTRGSLVQLKSNVSGLHEGVRRTYPGRTRQPVFSSTSLST